MSLIKSHIHHIFETKLYRSEKVTLEPLEEKEGTNTNPKFECHYTYLLYIGGNPRVCITFMCLGEPKIERVNNPKKYHKKNI